MFTTSKCNDVNIVSGEAADSALAARGTRMYAPKLQFVEQPSPYIRAVPPDNHYCYRDQQHSAILSELRCR